MLSATPFELPDSPTPAWFETVSTPATDFRLVGYISGNALGGSHAQLGKVDMAHWIVQLNNEGLEQFHSASETVAAFTGSDLDIQVLKGLGLPGQILIGTGCAGVTDVVTALRSNTYVDFFEPDAVHTASATPDDPKFELQHGLHNTGQSGGVVDADIDAPEAWEITTGSRDVVVAVIDTGVDYTHPDLVDNIWVNPGETPGNGLDDDNNGFIDDVHGWDFRNDDANPLDDHKHGTHVAGTIAAVGNNSRGVTGVAWNTTIMPLKFLGEDNSGYTSDAVSAINYATMMRNDHGVNVRVLNNSYTGQYSQATETAVAASSAANILFVAASGNGDALGRGFDIDSDPVYPASANAPSSIIVAATGQFDELARFSNFGVTTVDLAAPGVGIVSTLPTTMGSYGALSGTSMATPMVSGTAALLASQLDDITIQEIRAAILQSTDAVATLDGKVASGGRLNAHAALLIDTYRPRSLLVEVEMKEQEDTESHPITVNYRDNIAIDTGSLGDLDLIVRNAVTGQIPFSLTRGEVTGATELEKTVVYDIAAPEGGWNSTHNGQYNIFVAGGQVADSNGNTNLQSLLGSFEVGISLAEEMHVNSTEDLVEVNPGDGVSDAGNGKVTLRSSIMEANASAGLDSILLPAGTFTLTIAGQGEDAAASGDLDVTESVILIGQGPGVTIIDANALDRVIEVTAGNTLTLQDLTISGGLSTSGAGIYAEGDLVLDNVELRDNVASSDGGAIHAGELVTITSSSITGNSTAGSGGAIYAPSGTRVTLVDSLVANNSADEAGGGIFLTSALLEATNATLSGNQALTGGAFEAASVTFAQLTNVTVTNNTATNQGGGIRNDGSNITARNSIIAGNHSSTGHLNTDLDGAFNSQGNNIIGDLGGATGFVHEDSNDVVGSTGATVDPGLTPLGDYGGPALVHSLELDSIAIDTANDFYSPAADQRGISRPQNGDGTGDWLPDIGAFEFVLYAQVHGVKYQDLNGNGQKDPGEEGLAGWTLFIDTNENGLLDEGELSTESLADDPATLDVDEAGQYSLVDLLPGDYVIAEIPQDGWQRTDPAPPPVTYMAEPSLLAGDVMQKEGESGTTDFVFEVGLSWPVDATVSVDYQVVNVTTDSSDLAGTSGTLEIPPATISSQVAIPVNGDADSEGIEQFHLVLSAPVGVVLPVTTVTGTILDDDTTWLVNSTLDSPDLDPGDGAVTTGTAGEVTLRAAIMEANALAGDQSISLPAGRYVLSRAGAAEDGAATGDLDVTDAAGTLTIVGAGEGSTVIDADGLDRVLDVHAGAQLELVDLVLVGGASPVTEQGGGVRSSGGELTLIQVTVSGNESAAGGGGLAGSSGALVTLVDSRLTANTTAADGGGLLLDASSTAVITGSEVDTNTAGTTATGGGIASLGTLTVVSSEIHGNQAGAGAGVHAEHVATVDQSVVFDNHTFADGDGGGLYLAGAAADNGDFVVSASTIHGNIAQGDGGGLYVTATTSVLNSTIARNISLGDGGGVAADSNTAELQLLSTTITENRVAGKGGGLIRNKGVVEVGNTIISGNQSPLTDPDVSGSYDRLGVSTGMQTLNIIGGDAHLKDVGQQHPSYLPMADSPAVDAGDPNLAPALDGRNVTRSIKTGSRPGFIRKSSSTYLVAEPVPGENTFYSGLFASDLDADGNIDVIAYYQSSVFWQRNLGEGIFTGQIVITASSNIQGIVVEDVDGDTDRDVLVSTSDDKISWYENDGNEAFTVRSVTDSSNYARHLELLDMDNDGDRDIIAFENNTKRIVWYENDGEETFTLHVVGENTGSVTVMSTADFNGDGSPDVLSSTSERDIRIYFNDGNSNFAQELVYDYTYSGPPIAVNDFDGDGDVDFFVSYTGSGQGRLFDNDGSGSFTGINVSSIGTNFPLRLADLDADGDMDLVQKKDCCGNDRLYWLENVGPDLGRFKRESIPAGYQNTIFHLDIADLDGDGDQDLIVQDQTSYDIVWLENGAILDIGAVERTHLDSAAEPYRLSLSPGQVVETAHYGDLALPGHIDGTIFLDENENGSRDSGEGPLVDWPIFLDLNMNDLQDEGEPATTTDVLGYYEFANLDSLKTYKVAAEQPYGWDQTTPSVLPFPAAEDVLNPPGGASHVDDGWRVSVSGDVSVTGNPSHDGNGNDAGAVFVFRPLDGGWISAATLTASDAAAGDNFGSAVDVSDGTIVVGAVGVDDGGTNTGAAYIFQQDNGIWQEAAKLTAIDPQDGSGFGGSVAVSDNTVVVGARYADAAYVFEYQDGFWSQAAKLNASGDSSAQFGNVVAIEGQRIVVGAWSDDDGGSNMGAVYVFEKIGDSWTEVARLTASDKENDDYFGSAIGLDGSQLLVGAKNAGDHYRAGAGYIFEESNGAWTETARLTASDSTSYDQVGEGVAITGNTAVIGSRYDGFYIFEKTAEAWVETGGSSNSVYWADASAGQIVIGGRYSGQVLGEDPGHHWAPLGPGESVSNLVFGISLVPGQIQGKVFRDLDNDGIHDTTEAGLEGWIVYIDTDQDGTPGSGEPLATTAADGSYSFTGLDPFTTYTVAHVTEFGNQQTHPIKPSGADGIRVEAHANDTRLQTLYDIVGTATGDFYLTGQDLNGSGFNSQELFQYDASSGQLSTLAPVNDPRGVTTDGHSVYWIDVDQAGNPVIMRRAAEENNNEVVYPRTFSDNTIIQPVDLDFLATDEDGARLLVLDAEAGQLWQLQVGQQFNTITAVGPARYAAGSERHHLAWMDRVEDQVYVADPGVTGHADTPPLLEMIALDGDQWATIHAGDSSFTPRGIAVGEEQVYISSANEIYQVPRGGGDVALLTTDNRFGYLAGMYYQDGVLYVVDNVDARQAVSWEVHFNSTSVANEDRAWQIEIGPGGHAEQIDFGDIDSTSLGGASANSGISGRVITDLDGDGVQDANEEGVVDVTVMLDLNNNGRLDSGEPVSVTLADDTGTSDDEAGTFAFSELTAGTYNVVVLPPAGQKQLSPMGTAFHDASISAGEGPRSADAADLDGDGDMDLVLGNGNSNSITLVRNNGTAGFETWTTIVVGSGPADVKVADDDGDGDMDLIVANLYSSTVSLLRNNGDGSFAAAQEFSVGMLPIDMAWADVNGDARLDILVANEYSSTISVLLGNEDGSYQEAVHHAANAFPEAITVLDYDADGDLDAAVVNFNANSVTLLENNGAGVFSIAASHAVGKGPFSITAGDLNADGHIDLAVANVLENNNSVSLLFADGSGGFNVAVGISAGRGPTGVTLVDADLDGDLDLAASSSGDTNISILMNQGDGTFQTPSSTGVGNFFNSLPFDVLASDLDNDGRPDFIVTDGNQNQLSLLDNQLTPSAHVIQLSSGTAVEDLVFGIGELGVPSIGLVNDVTVDENTGQLAVALTDITAGVGENQPVRVTAQIADADLVSLIDLDYQSPASQGSVLLTPAVATNGQATVTVTVTQGGSDGKLATSHDNQSTSTSFLYTIEEINDLPTLGELADVSLVINASEQTVNLSGITAGTGESQPLRVTATSSNTDLIPTPQIIYTPPQTVGALTFTPAVDSHGTATITVMVEDGGLDGDLSSTTDNATTSQVFTVEVKEVNTDPTLDAISSLTIDEDASEQTVSLSGITAGGSDSQPLRVTAVSNNTGLVANPEVTYASAQQTGTIRFTPVGNTSGTATITVTVEDAGVDGDLSSTEDNGTTSEVFTLTVMPVNDLPTLGALSNLTIAEDADQQTVNLSGIAAGTGESQPLRVTATSSDTDLIPTPQVTYTTPQAIGTLRFTPLEDANGSATIKVLVEDGGLDGDLSSTADNAMSSRTFTVNVTEVNDLPTLNTFSNLTVTEDASEQTVNLSGITAGGGESQPLQVTAVSNNTALVANPQVTYTSAQQTGTIRFTPVGDASGTALITVIVEDGGLDGNLETAADNAATNHAFTLAVTAVNDLPVLSPLPDLQLVVNNEFHGGGTNLFDYVADVDSDTMQTRYRIANLAEIDSRFGLSIGDAGGSGSFARREDSTIHVHPSNDFIGQVSVVIEAQDEEGDAGNSQTFLVRVVPPNSAPVASDVGLATPDNTNLVRTVENGLVSLVDDVDDDPLTFSLVADVLHGELSLASNGSFTYTPDEKFNRVDSFTYKANDGELDSNVATMTISIDTSYAWYNYKNRWDVDEDNGIHPVDALYIIDAFHSGVERNLPNDRPRPLTKPFYDVNWDSKLTLDDAQQIVDWINNPPSGEGEAEGEAFSSGRWQPLATSQWRTDSAAGAPSPVLSGQSHVEQLDDACRSLQPAAAVLELVDSRTASQPHLIDQVLEDDLDSLLEDELADLIQ